jgi:hypothetical protein
MKAHFIGEPITVTFDKLPFLSKKPGCPDRFEWQGETYEIAELLREWQEYGRRGRMASSMRPAHASIAAQRGSWGVGRFYFRVRVEDGRVFELYYDRAPKDVDRRKGSWVLTQEIEEG